MLVLKGFLFLQVKSQNKSTLPSFAKQKGQEPNVDCLADLLVVWPARQIFQEEEEKIYVSKKWNLQVNIVRRSDTIPTATIGIE